MLCLHVHDTRKQRFAGDVKKVGNSIAFFLLVFVAASIFAFRTTFCGIFTILYEVQEARGHKPCFDNGLSA